MRDVSRVLWRHGRRTWGVLVRPGRLLTQVLSVGCAGSLLGAGFVFPGFWWLGLLGILLFFGCVHQAGTNKQAALYGWVVATVASAWSLVWFWSVLPIDWIPVGGIWVQGLVVALYWGTAALWLGVRGLLVGALGWWVLRRYPRSWWWSVPTIWVMGESLGALVFAVMTWQAGIPLTPHFSFGFVGYLLAQHAWLFHIAAVAGVYGLSWAMVCIGGALYYFGIVSSRWRWVLGVVAVLGVLQAVPVPVNQGSVGVTVAAVETRFTGPYRREHAVAATVEAAVETAKRAGAQYIVLPEDMRYITSRLESPLLPITLRQQWGSSTVTIIDSGRVDTSSGAVLRGVVYENNRAKRWVADKQYLVPQGEFVPAIYAAVLSRVGYGAVLEEIQQEVNYLPGPLAEQHFTGQVPGILFCFESVTPWGMRRVLAAREQPPVFVAHPISHAWFHTPEVLWQQLDTMLRVQVRWNQVPVVSAGNFAPSTVYYPDGTINRTPGDVLLVNERVQVKLLDL